MVIKASEILTVMQGSEASDEMMSSITTTNIAHDAETDRKNQRYARNTKMIVASLVAVPLVAGVLGGWFAATNSPSDDGIKFLEGEKYTNVRGGSVDLLKSCPGGSYMARKFAVTTQDGKQAEVSVCYNYLRGLTL